MCWHNSWNTIYNAHLVEDLRSLFPPSFNASQRSNRCGFHNTTEMDRRLWFTALISLLTFRFRLIRDRWRNDPVSLVLDHQFRMLLSSALSPCYKRRRRTFVETFSLKACKPRIESSVQKLAQFLLCGFCMCLKTNKVLMESTLSHCRRQRIVINWLQNVVKLCDYPIFLVPDRPLGPGISSFSFVRRFCFSLYLLRDINRFDWKIWKVGYHNVTNRIWFTVYILTNTFEMPEKFFRINPFFTNKNLHRNVFIG